MTNLCAIIRFGDAYIYQNARGSFVTVRDRHEPVAHNLRKLIESIGGDFEWMKGRNFTRFAVMN